jgi:hypothetical protein
MEPLSDRGMVYGRRGCTRVSFFATMLPATYIIIVNSLLLDR